MRPVLDIFVEGGWYFAHCMACPMQCQGRAKTVYAAVHNLPCGSVYGISKTVEAWIEDARKRRARGGGAA